MSTFGFRTLVLGVIAGALAVSTALLGWLAYATVYQQILSGFDRKLLGISGAVAALTDGDAHAEYQVPHRITRWVAAGPDMAWGWDAERGALVRVDLARSAVVEYRSWPDPPRSLLWLEPTARLWVQKGDGTLVDAADPATPLRDLEPGDWVTDGIRLYRRDGVLLHPQPIVVEAGAEPAPELVPIRLGAEVDLLAWDRFRGQWLGLDREAGELFGFSPGGELLERRTLALGEHVPVGLVATETGFLIAADEVLGVDPAAPEVIDAFEPGWFDEAHPFFARHAPMYRALRERVGLTFLYTEVYIGGDRIRYILDGSVGEDHSPPGFLDTVPDADIDALVRAQVEGTPFVSGIRQWEAWGLVKVSAAPIRNRQGEIVALAGADVDIGVIRSKTRNALFAVLGVGALLLMVSGLVSLWVAQSITRPLRDIKYAALTIAAGQYGARVKSTAADEIGRLAASLDRLSLRLLAQSEASSASQSALLCGRLDGALRAALGGEAEHPRAWWLGYTGGRLLFLDREEDADETARALRRGMLRVLARRIGAGGPPEPALLLGADPDLDLVLDWKPRERRLHWVARQRGLLAVHPDGSRHALPSGVVQIAADWQVVLDHGLLLLDRGESR